MKEKLSLLMKEKQELEAEYEDYKREKENQEELSQKAI